MKNKSFNYNVILWIVLSLLLIYLIVYTLGSITFFGNPIFPFFTGITEQVNYILLIIFFIVLQIVVVAVFYKLFTFVFRKILTVKNKLENWSFNIQSYLVTR